MAAAGAGTSGDKVRNWVRYLIAVALSAFAVYTAAFGVMPTLVQGSVHLALALMLVFTLSPTDDPMRSWASGSILNWALALAAGAVIGYPVVFYNDIVLRHGAMTTYEMWLGAAAVILLLEGTRRIIGLPMVILAVVFIAYALFGRSLPGILQHRGYDLQRVLSQVYLGADGIFGTPLNVSSTYVIMIVVFGTLLETTGASRVLMDIAVGLTGRSRGGPAKAAVVGSSLMGMISGTAVANVLTTGTITIPLMKRAGYRPASAGAIEAAASTGGQMTPPVMGAAAFIMADMIQLPYSDIALAALLPASLFYIAVFAAVHLEAVRDDIGRLDSQQLPSLKASLLEGGHVLLSIPIFVGMLISGYSVMYSSLVGVLSVIALSLLRHTTRVGPGALITSLARSSEAILTVALATGTAGIIIAIITLTGLGLKFSSLIVAASGGSLLIALILTMVASLILGMGLPTAAAYILVATLVAPALVNLGVDILAAHLFVFYWAVLSAITPPVALAAFAAAALARDNPIRVAAVAVKYSIAAFIIPYLFVLDPALIGRGTVSEVAHVYITGLFGVIALACAAQGWAVVRALAWERAALAVGALALIKSGTTSDFVGLPIIAAVILIQLLRRRWQRRNSRLQDEATQQVARNRLPNDNEAY